MRYSCARRAPLLFVLARHRAQASEPSSHQSHELHRCLALVTSGPRAYLAPLLPNPPPSSLLLPSPPSLPYFKARTSGSRCTERTVRSRARRALG